MILTRNQYYNNEGFKVISQEIVDQRRWCVVERAVIQLDSDGTFWCGSWDEAATEIQEGGYDDDIAFVQVYPHEVSITVYKTEPE